jgi:hypothetical protein
MSAKLNVDIVAQLKEFNKAMADLKSEVNSVNSSIDKSNKQSAKSTNALSSSFSNLGKTVGGLFAADILLSFGKSIISTTAEFQKMEAVLTTTLGSKSAAQVAMQDIVEFASKTPFQVNELTDAFVKLANRGFRPTLAQMTSLGDLASSTGKSFDQLTEAALDAMTGEFERLKEFGIRASSEGDRVKFTFKGVTTEVQKTDAAIQDYLISLGQAEGVSGSMAAISETVGGQISNLEDNFTQLQLAIGTSSSGLISSVLQLSNLMLSDLVTSLNAVNTVAQAAGDNGLQAFGRQLLSFIDPAYAATLEGVAIGINAIKKAAVESEEAIKNENLAKEQAKKVSAELAEKHKKELEDLKKKAEAAKKAHEERIKQLRKESEEFQKHVRDTYKLVVRDPFAEKGPDLNRNADPERQQIMENAAKRLLDLNKKIGASMKGIIIPEDAIIRANAYKKSQQDIADQAALVAQNMGAALFVGDMFAQTLSQLSEGGKNLFQGILDSLKALIIRFIAAIAAAITLNILTGGAVMAAGKATGAKGLGALIKGGKSYGIGGLTPFAAGGIVSGPTAALVGEYTGAKTNPEVIAPLSKLQNMMGGNVTFTISGDNLVGTLNRATKTRQRKF